jgi:hypothetical protein
MTSGLRTFERDDVGVVEERRCFFCAGAAVEGYVVTSSAPERFALGEGRYTRKWCLLLLCVRHRAALVDAGRRGRIHKSTGVRFTDGGKGLTLRGVGADEVPTGGIPELVPPPPSAWDAAR